MWPYMRNNKVTKAVMSSHLVPCVLGVVYIYLTWWAGAYTPPLFSST